MRLIPYRNTHYANIKNLNFIDTSDLYVSAAFIGSGRQDFIVKHKNHFYFH